MDEPDELKRAGHALLLFVALFGLGGFIYTDLGSAGVAFGQVLGVVVLYIAILCGGIGIYDSIISS